MTPFEIEVGADGTVRLSGRFDASQAERAAAALAALDGPAVADCAGLEYISSAGLSVLILTHKRLLGAGHGLRLVNLQPRVRNVLRYAGLDKFLVTD